MALWALFLQILLPLGQGIALPAADGGLPRSLVICSANGGFRTIPLPSRDGGAATGGDGQAVQRDCPICLSYAAGNHLTVPYQAAISIPFGVSISPQGVALSAPIDQSPSGPQQARAPPLSLG